MKIFQAQPTAERPTAPSNVAYGGHERRFRGLRGTSAYPPRLAVKADIPDRQVRAKERTRSRGSALRAKAGASDAPDAVIG